MKNDENGKNSGLDGSGANWKKGDDGVVTKVRNFGQGAVSVQFVIAIRIPWTERYQDTFKAADGWHIYESEVRNEIRLRIAEPGDVKGYREIAVHNLGYIVERSENRAPTEAEGETMRKLQSIVDKLKEMGVVPPAGFPKLGVDLAIPGSEKTVVQRHGQGPQEAPKPGEHTVTTDVPQPKEKLPRPAVRPPAFTDEKMAPLRRDLGMKEGHVRMADGELLPVTVVRWYPPTPAKAKNIVTAFCGTRTDAHVPIMWEEQQAPGGNVLKLSVRVVEGFGDFQRVRPGDYVGMDNTGKMHVWQPGRFESSFMEGSWRMPEYLKVDFAGLERRILDKLKDDEWEYIRKTDSSPCEPDDGEEDDTDEWETEVDRKLRELRSADEAHADELGKMVVQLLKLTERIADVTAAINQGADGIKFLNGFATGVSDRADAIEKRLKALEGAVQSNINDVGGYTRGLSDRIDVLARSVNEQANTAHNRSVTDENLWKVMHEHIDELKRETERLTTEQVEQSNTLARLTTDDDSVPPRLETFEKTLKSLSANAAYDRATLRNHEARLKAVTELVKADSDDCVRRFTEATEGLDAERLRVEALEATTTELTEAAKQFSEQLKDYDTTLGTLHRAIFDAEVAAQDAKTTGGFGAEGPGPLKTPQQEAVELDRARRRAGEGLEDIGAHKAPLFEFYVDGLRFMSAYQTVTGQLILDHAHAYGAPTNATLLCCAINADGKGYLQRLDPLGNYQLPERFITITEEQLENL